MSETILKTIPKDKELVKPIAGEISPDQLKKILWSFVIYTCPIFFGTLFSLLALDVEIKPALIGAAISLYAPLASYFNKRRSTDEYLRDK